MFAIIALALLMMAIDATIVATALPALQQGLGASINLAGWTITAYAFGFVLMLPVSGMLAQRYGKRRMFLASTLAFTLASLGCGLANDIHSLIVLRALQAAGGAGFTPTATGIIVDHFGKSRDRYVSLFGSIFPLGAMIGPIFGGHIVEWFSWREVFFVNVPIGLLLLALAWHFIPHDRREARKLRTSFDLIGLVLLGGSLLAGMLAVSVLGSPTAEEGGWQLSAVAGLGMLAVLSGAAFIGHIRRSTAPFIAPQLIYGQYFGTINLINLIFSGFIIGGTALMPLYAASRYGISAVGAGSLLTAQGLAAVSTSLLAVFLLRRSGYRLPLYLGSVLTCAGLALVALPPQFGLSPWMWLASATFLVGAGNGAINPAMRNAGLQLAPESASMIAALRTLSLQIGSITMVSVVTAILAHQQEVGAVLGWIYATLALIRLVAMVLIRYIPEQRGAW